MPELPEVETVRRTLQRLVAGKTIRRVDVRLPRIVRRPAEPEAFARALEGLTIRSVERRGKFLKFDLEALLLISHLRMEGRYGLYAAEDEIEPHTHVVFQFTDGTELRYRDVRQFGTMDLYRPGEELEEGPLHKLGLEPLDPGFTEDAFRASIAGRSTKIKPLLLNQECVVGLGNIYVDEALHTAGIHPERAAASLKRTEIARLYEAIVRTLSDAVEAGGSSVKSYVNGQGEQGAYQFRLRAYGRQHEPCATCGNPIVKFVVGGRGTHVCPRCQPAPKKKRVRRPS
ncbi:DNA-formamidopyrimidine glycosylase [Paenibacillus sp. TRM 82003]|nr:DNA-formamidopyrimidine glycosylase [Paenibacillus sp. TRM 82003]